MLFLKIKLVTYFVNFIHVLPMIPLYSTFRRILKSYLFANQKRSKQGLPLILLEMHDAT